MHYITLDLEWNQAYAQKALAVQRRLSARLRGEVAKSLIHCFMFIMIVLLDGKCVNVWYSIHDFFSFVKFFEEIY